MTEPLDDEAVRVGRRIRELRKERGLTLVQLASRVDVSQGFLSLAERGHARLSLASMGRISSEFDLRPGQLLAQDFGTTFSGDGLHVIRGEHSSRVPGGPRDSWKLAHTPGGLSGVEFVDSNTEFVEFASHEVDEWIYVLDGVLDVAVSGADRTLSLSPGDSAAFTGGVAHAWRSGTPNPFRLLIVTAPRR